MTASPATEGTKKKAGLGTIFLILFLDILGFSIVLPFLAEEARNTFGTSEAVGTLLAAIYSLMQFLFVPVWGRLSDRTGRRPVLVWSVFATAIGMFGLGGALIFSQTVAWLFVARAASGIATANIGTASAYIADITGPEDRAKGMSTIGVAFGLGFILGPAIGGILSSITIHGRAGAVPCLVAGGLSLLNFLWALTQLKESLPRDRRSTKKRSLSPLDLGAARDAFARPGIARAVIVNFVLILSFTILDQTFRFFNKDLFQMSAIDTGLMLGYIGVVAALVQGGLVRRLAKKYDETYLVRWGIGIQVFAFAGLAAAPSIGKNFLYVAGAFLAIGNGLSAPSISTFVSKRADPREQGATLGTNQSAASLARMFGPALGGVIYGSLGARWPYVMSAIGMAFATLLALTLKPLPKPE